MSLRETSSILRAWNADNLDPLSDFELAQVILNASKYLRSNPSGTPERAA